MTLTEAGQSFYEAAVRITDDFEAAESLIGRGQTEPSGLVRVTAAPAFARLHLVPRLPHFFARYPDISVELQVSERTINLIEEGIAVRPRDSHYLHYDGGDASLSRSARGAIKPD